MTGRVLPAAARQTSTPQPAAPPPVPRIAQTCRSGDRVRWQRYVGRFLRTTVEGDAELLIGRRTYRVPAKELRPV